MSRTATTQSPSYSPAPNQDRFIKPNPHPYAIKTTSSGLLTRSNSTSQNTQASRHYYVPPSPTQEQTRRPRTHRLSKSLTNAAPRPLPTPPDHISTLQSPPEGLSWLTPRSDSVEISHIKLEDLPSNPKVWTPSQLSSYLATALRVQSGETLSLPLSVARDVAAFVKESKINGRIFLRLCEQDLEAMGVNKLWQTALLTSSRDLRQNVLKGRIWGTSAEEDQFPFSSDLYNTSTSSIELPEAEPESTRRGRRRRNGRVRGMVDSFERSGSFSSDASFSDTGSDIGTADQFVDAVSVIHSPTELSSVNSSPSRRPLPVPPVHPSLREHVPEPEEEEPTMEELLAADTESARGGRAWEEMDKKARVTVKKLLTNGPTGDADDALNTIVESKSRSSKGSNKSRHDRRVVTAIFNPPVTESVDEALKASEEELESQVKSTSALLEEFKKRLEDVERKVKETEDQFQLGLQQKEEENEALRAQLKEKEQALVKASAPRPLPRKISMDLDPHSMTALSRYVILAGIGVCAVVLRVVLRKVVGKR